MYWIAIARLAARNLLRHRRRSFNAIIAVSFGVTALAVASGFMEWMFVDFREATIESQFAHIQLARPGYQENGRSDPFRYLLPKDFDAAGLGLIPHLRSIAPRLMVTGLVGRGDATVSFIGEGVDPGADLASDRALRMLEGHKLMPGGQGEVLLGQGLATLIGAKVGEAVVLLVSTPRGGLSAVEVRVVGMFSAVSKAYDDSALLVSLESARTLLKVQGAHTWRLYLDDTGNTREVATYLRERLNPQSLDVRTWDQLAEFYVRAVALLREQLDVLRAIVIAIILLGIGNSMMMAVMERTGEIGTAMALGVKRRALLGQFVAEGALVGLIGGMVGLLLAFLISAWIGTLNIEMPPPPGLTRGYLARIMITGPIVFEGLSMAVATTMLASLYPAWRAARMSIVDAIRHNR